MAQQKKIKNHIKADHILKNFWKDNSRFADLFNACERIVSQIVTISLTVRVVRS